METATKKQPRQYIDYRLLADEYNRAPVRGTVRIPRVYNITLFRRALTNRGLAEKDFSVANRGKECVIYKWTETAMKLD